MYKIETFLLESSVLPISVQKRTRSIVFYLENKGEIYELIYSIGWIKRTKLSWVKQGATGIKKEFDSLEKISYHAPFFSAYLWEITKFLKTMETHYFIDDSILLK